MSETVSVRHNEIKYVVQIYVQYLLWMSYATGIKIFSNLKFEFMPANFEINAKTKNLQKLGVL